MSVHMKDKYFFFFIVDIMVKYVFRFRSESLIQILMIFIENDSSILVLIDNKFSSNLILSTDNDINRTANFLQNVDSSL